MNACTNARIGASPSSRRGLERGYNPLDERKADA
jgi:hypothetical protein